MEGDGEVTTYRIEEIKQKDNHTFTIKWTDGVEKDYRLSDLQKRCPCANCVDEASGVRVVNPETIDESVKARKISSVGRYAIRVDFTSGCSLGIYSYEDLRN